MKEFKKLRILVWMAVIALVVAPMSSFSYAATDQSKTWNDFGDWSLWNKDKVTDTGLGGLRLQSKGSGFERSGTISYQFSPGGTENTWSSVSHISENAGDKPADTVWASLYSDNKVAQIDPTTATVIKEWSVGRDPSRTATGCGNNDVWVGDRNGSAVSHIIPEKDKVITHSAGASETVIRGMAVQCPTPSDPNTYIWVGFSGTSHIVKINAAQFDALDPDPTKNDPTIPFLPTAQVGSTITNACPPPEAPGDPPNGSVPGYCPYGFVLGSYGDNHLYVSNYMRGVLSINTSTMAADTPAGWDTASPYGITNDSYGNIWTLGGNIARATSASIDPTQPMKTFPGVGNGLAIMPPKTPGNDTANDILIVGDHSSPSLGICTYEITGNSTNNPDLTNKQCYSNTTGFTVDSPSGSTASPGGIGYDDNGNIWQLTRHGDLVIEYLKATNYTTSVGIKLSDPQYGNAHGELYTYSDFMGNALSNTQPSLTYEFSTSGADGTWQSEDDLNNGNVADSASLFIRVSFRGGGTNSPILDSLTVNYGTKEEPKILLEKKVYNVSSGQKANAGKVYNVSSGQKANAGNESATFVPGDHAVVKIKVDPMGINGLNLHVRDYRPAGTSISQITDSSKCNLSSGENFITGDFQENAEGNSYSEWSNIAPSSTGGVFCYEYDVSNSEQPRNDLTQARVMAFNQDEFSPDNFNGLVSSYSSYIMVKGFSFANSESNPVKLDDGSVVPQVFPINDILSFARTVSYYSTSGGSNSNLTYSPSYIYERGLGKNSRAGELYSLPVKLIDDQNQIISVDSSYLLYNPAYYLFGNLFSGSATTNKLDFSSRASSVSNSNFPSDQSNRLNSEASLYNYFFDQKSVLYWNNKATSPNYKNAQMTQSINDLINNKPPEFCPAAGAPSLKVSKLDIGNEFHLDGKDCNNPATSSDDTWPNGRVWYFDKSSFNSTGHDVNIAANFHGRGTVIIDYSGTQGGKVNISTTSSSFADDGTALGLIVINGGKVVFTKAATTFNGIVFDPGNPQ